jgi:hypothetical protein
MHITEHARMYVCWKGKEEGRKSISKRITWHSRVKQPGKLTACLSAINFVLRLFVLSLFRSFLVDDLRYNIFTWTLDGDIGTRKQTKKQVTMFMR